MSWSLFSEAGSPIHLLPALPDGYRGRIFPGATVLGSRCPEGQVAVQELVLPSFLLRFNFFSFVQRTTLVGRLLASSLQARVLLKGSFSARVEGLGRLHLKEGQYTLVGLPPTECRVSVDRGASWQSFDIFYPEGALRELMPFFPRLEKALDAFTAGKAVSFTSPHSWATADMLRLVEDLLACPFSEGLRTVYLENKIRELLLLQLYGAFEKTLPSEGPFSNREVAAAYQVRNFILQHQEKHYTIGELARMAGLNEYILKAVFKHVFGTGPFECLLQARMERARTLLLESDLPVKAIASQTGYQFQTSFITAFKKFYGYTPASLRRKEE